jgi:hypothetical protein
MRKIWEKGALMGRIRFTPEQIVGKLREAEVLLSQEASESVPRAIRPMSRKRDTTRRLFSYISYRYRGNSPRAKLGTSLAIGLHEARRTT